MENYNLIWFDPYLKSLGSNEASTPSTPTESTRFKTAPYFAEKMEGLRQGDERCSDDFRFSFDIDNSPQETEPTPLTVSYKKDCGRFLQATRDIEAGETIFWEPPIVLSPKAGAGPTCLNCFKNLPEVNWPICNACQCPKCNESCEGSEHNEMECKILEKIFKNSDISKNINDVKKLNITLTPLRTFIAIVKTPSIEKIILSLQSNISERKQLSIGHFIEKHIVSFFEDFPDLNIDSNFVHRICGVFDTNAFDVTIENRRQARALLPLAALMNHSCTPNTQHWFLFGSLVVRACVPIKKGEIVTNSYTQTLLGNKNRKDHLAFTKLFKCECKRCQDPTELGSYLSSILCQKCKTGLLTPSHKIFSCSSCENSIPTSSSMNIVNVVSGIVMAAEDMETELLRETIQRVKTMIGFQHYSSVRLQYIYLKKIVNNLGKARVKEMMECLTMVEDLINLASKIEPGFTRTRGILLYYKIAITSELISRKIFLRYDCDDESENLPAITLPLSQLIKEMDEHLKECEFILKWDTLLEDIQETADKWRALKEKLQH